MTPAPFFRSLDPSLVKSNAELKDLTAVEDILMVGYPNEVEPSRGCATCMMDWNAQRHRLKAEILDQRPWAMPRASLRSVLSEGTSQSRQLMSAFGTKLPNLDVSFTVAIGGEPDMMQIAQFGRD